MNKIKRDDTVFVITGKDRGKQGPVRRVLAREGRLVVQGINMVKKHQKPQAHGTQAGIIEREAPIRVSNVMLVCKSCRQPTRVGFAPRPDGVKARVCRKLRGTHRLGAELGTETERVLSPGGPTGPHEGVQPPNTMEAPRLDKIVLNIGLGEALQNPKALDSAAADIAAIAGQKPVINRAKRSIANFKVRQGNPIGLMVTVRGDRMWEFYDRLVNAALPRIRDFHGVSGKGFDGRGNYSLGLREQLIFPEIEYDKIDRIRGLQVVIVTTARTDEEGKRLLQLLGMPFSHN